MWSGAGAPQREEKKFKVEGSVARYSSTFGSGCQGALFTGFAAERTINSTPMQVVNARQRSNLRLLLPRENQSRGCGSLKVYRFNSTTMKPVGSSFFFFYLTLDGTSSLSLTIKICKETFLLLVVSVFSLFALIFFRLLSDREKFSFFERRWI